MSMNRPVRILCVDDESSILKSLKRLFMDSEYEILTATSATEGLALLQKNTPIQVVVSDYRMPVMNGVDFLREVCRSWPETVRIVLSGYADTASVVSAINEGEIYKFIPKPWNDDELKVAIANAAERYYLHKQNIELTQALKEKNEALQQINENLERLVQERTQEIVFQNLALQRSQNILDTLPVAVVGLDFEGLIVQCNNRGASLFSWSILGKNRSEIFSPELNDFVDSVCLNGEAVRKFVLGHTHMMVKGACMHSEDGQQGIVLVFEDGAHE